MDLGEEIECDDEGVVSGTDTGRVVAKFSHAQEAKAFCELLQNMQRLKLKIIIDTNLATQQ